jgi:hypothetical protein
MTPAQEPRFPIEWLRFIFVIHGWCSIALAETITYKNSPCCNKLCLYTPEARKLPGYGLRLSQYLTQIQRERTQ